MIVYRRKMREGKCRRGPRERQSVNHCLGDERRGDQDR